MATNTRLDASPSVAAHLADDVRAASTVAQPTTIAVGDRSYPLSPDLAALLLDLLDDVAEGRDVTVAPAGLPVGTELASELLGVSRPWLTTLLDRGDIPSTRAGSKRRVRLGALLAYRRADDEPSKSANKIAAGLRPAEATPCMRAKCCGSPIALSVASIDMPTWGF